MLFKRNLQRYGDTSDPITPYQKAAQIWDDRIGAATVQAGNWRLMALCASLCSLALTGGIIWQSSQSRVTPYVVEVDTLGQVKAVQPATASYSPTDAQVSWYLGRFITDVRGLSIDPVVARQNWQEAYGFATGHAVAFLNAEAQANDPFAGIGQRSTSISITSVVRASPTAFQVKWQEQAFTQGIPAGVTHWTAILTIQQSLPRQEAILRKNPLGLYVTDMAWSQEFATATTK
jgi:type IV secretion system protein VirB5